MERGRNKYINERWKNTWMTRKKIHQKGKYVGERRGNTSARGEKTHQ